MEEDVNLEGRTERGWPSCLFCLPFYVLMIRMTLNSGWDPLPGISVGCKIWNLFSQSPKLGNPSSSKPDLATTPSSNGHSLLPPHGH